MPPIIRFTREAVLNAAYQLVRREGIDALNARAVARELGGSTQPIFRLFQNMDELTEAVRNLAADIFRDSMMKKMELSDNPFLIMGMHYISYAVEEPELFKLLFMCDRLSNGWYTRETRAYSFIYDVISSSLNVSHEQAAALYARVWVYTHGLAVSIVTKYIPCKSAEEMRAMLTESFLAAAHQLGLNLPEA